MVSVDDERNNIGKLKTNEMCCVGTKTSATEGRNHTA